MSTKGIQFSVFTKPWKNVSITALAEFVSGIGFDGIEFPVRPGYQVEPDTAEKDLPLLVKQLAEYGLKVYSVASGTDEKIFAACAEAGVPIIRMMPEIKKEEGYIASEQRVRAQLASLRPLCDKYGVKIGIQQHYGDHIVDSIGMARLLEGFEAQYFGAIWDAAHDALAGQQPELGLDIVWSHLCMVNLKNAYYRHANGSEAENAQWSRYFTTGRQGLASWPRAASELQRRRYQGVVCLTAEYTAEQEVNRLIQEDFLYAKSLFE